MNVAGTPETPAGESPQTPDDDNWDDHKAGVGRPASPLDATVLERAIAAETQEIATKAILFCRSVDRALLRLAAVAVEHGGRENVADLLRLSLPERYFAFKAAMGRAVTIAHQARYTMLMAYQQQFTTLQKEVNS
jgi:hypothetical protein